MMIKITLLDYSECLDLAVDCNDWRRQA